MPGEQVGGVPEKLEVVVYKQVLKGAEKKVDIKEGKPYNPKDGRESSG